MTITKQFVVPIMPNQQAPQLPIIYPWEKTDLYNLCAQLYELARKTGYTETFEEFKDCFGAYLETSKSLVDIEDYTGQYEVIPLPNVEQILRTTKTILRNDVIVKPIPYYETSNDAGGYTIIIG